MINEIVATYFASRPNKDQPHGKLAVLFLACSGSGKSTITEAIVRTMGATYVRNDDARRLLHEHRLDVSPKVVIDATWERLRQESPNQFVVFDSNMSGYYMHEDSYYAVARRLGYRLFIIAIQLSKAELTNRIKNRGRSDTEEVLELLPTQLAAQQKAMDELVPNLTVGPETPHAEVLAALQAFQRG